MAPSTIYLHIGAPRRLVRPICKTCSGQTSQSLKSLEFCVQGKHVFARVSAMRDVMQWDPGAEPVPPRWRRIALEMQRWGNRGCVFSQESVCFAVTDERTHALVSRLSRSDEVKCVLTVRDVSRLVTAQWRTSMRSRRRWTFTDYAAAVAGVSHGKQAPAMHEHFLLRHDFSQDSHALDRRGGSYTTSLYWSVAGVKF